MMRSRRLVHAAIAALAAMLFAQAAFALAACDPLQAKSRAHMIAAQPDEPSPCHQPADNATLCLTHCQAGEQTLDKHSVKVPDVSSDAVLVVRGWSEVRQPVRFIARAPLPASGPPPRILFRALLI
jgi:hypothetical protein